MYSEFLIKATQEKKVEKRRYQRFELSTMIISPHN